jgi:glutathione synthase/RimK-type ligase-like ATP-grasp enzyme
LAAKTKNLFIVVNSESIDIEVSVFEILPVMFADKNIKNIFIIDAFSSSNNKFINGTTDIVEVIKYDKEFILSNSKEWLTKSSFSIKITDINILFMLSDGLSMLNRYSIKENIKNVPYIINDPEGTNITGVKKFLLQVPDLTPDIKLIDNIDILIDFLNEHNEIVLKPMNSNQGNGLIRINKTDIYFEKDKFNFEDKIDEVFDIINKSEMLGMRYLKGVSDGDKRIFIANGDIITTILRVPKKGDWMANLAQGATAEFNHPITDNELLIVEKITEITKEYGIFIIGLDTIFDEKTGLRVLSEINTSNVGGILDKKTAEKYWKSVTKIFD